MTTDIVIGVAGIVLGFITSFIFYNIQKRRRELCWSIDSTSLIKGYSSLFEKLEILYGGQKIENLTVSKIALWNNGNETIDSKDIAIPLFIFPRDEKLTKILDAKIIKISTVGNAFEIHQEPDDPTLDLRFDYVDPQQGAVIQVIHTGVSILPLMIDGEIKGVREIEYKSKRLDFVSQASRFFMYFYALIVIGLLGIYAYNSTFLGIFPNSNWSVLLLVFMLSFLVLFMFFDIRQWRNTAKIPKDLSVFEKDDIDIKNRN